MKSKILSLITAISMILTLIVLPQTVTADTTAANIKLGDYVEMGTYYGEPILWRCVGFEKYDSDTGVIDSTDTVTEYQDGYLPLMLADKIITFNSSEVKFVKNPASWS